MATRRAVCLLRSRRRTFLFYDLFAEYLSYLFCSFPQVQELDTIGASGVAYFAHQGRYYIVITSYQDNDDMTNINSNMYQWDSVANRFNFNTISHREQERVSFVQFTKRKVVAQIDFIQKDFYNYN